MNQRSDPGFEDNLVKFENAVQAKDVSLGAGETLFGRVPVHCLVLLQGSNASSTTCGHAVVLALLGYSVSRGTS